MSDDGSRAVRAIALAVIPFFILAGTTTHALEIFTFLFFLAALAAVAVTKLDRGADAKRAVALVMVVGVALGSFMAIHARSVPYRASWDQSEKDALRQQLPSVSTLEAVIGDIGDGSGSLLARQNPLTAAAALGVPALAVAALRMPASAALLALAAVPLAVLYATRAGNIIIALVTSPQFSRDVDPYFMLLGLVGLALGIVAAGGAILTRMTQRFHRITTAALVTVAFLAGGAAAALWFGHQAANHPGAFLHAAMVSALAVIGVAARTGAPALGRPPFPVALAALAACLTVPLAVPGAVFGGPYVREANLTLFSRFAAAAARPDVFDRPGYYEELGRTISPPLSIPGAVIEEMRRRIEPRRVVLANPAYSCALVVFLDAYCINPEYVYGVFFQTATPYLTDFVRRDSDKVAVHPFFNSEPSLSEREIELVRRYRVAYVLADPAHVSVIDGKIRHGWPAAAVVFDREGYRLYRMD